MTGPYDAVSYTHLDVYKRQPAGRLGRGGPGLHPLPPLSVCPSPGGPFPTLIAIITMFFVGTSGGPGRGLLAALLLTGAVSYTHLVQLRPLRIAGVADAQALVIPLRPWGIGVERESAALGCAVGPGVGQGIMLGLVGGSARGATAQIFQADTDGAAPAAGQALAPLTRGATVRSLSRQGIGCLLYTSAASS